MRPRIPKDSRYFTNFAGEAEPFVDIGRLKGKVIYIYLNPQVSGRAGITFK